MRLVRFPLNLCDNEPWLSDVYSTLEHVNIKLNQGPVKGVALQKSP